MHMSEGTPTEAPAQGQEPATEAQTPRQEPTTEAPAPITDDTAADDGVLMLGGGMGLG